MALVAPFGRTAAERHGAFWFARIRAARCGTTRKSCRRCPGSRQRWLPSWACGALRRAAVSLGAASRALGRAGAVPGWADENSSVLTPPCACSGQEAAGEAGGQLPLLLPPGRGRGRGVGGAGDPRGPEAGAHGRVSRSPSEPCCWSAAEWPRKSRAASLSVSAVVPTVSTPDSCSADPFLFLRSLRLFWIPRPLVAQDWPGCQCPLGLVLVLVSSPTLCPFPAERGTVCELGVYSQASAAVSATGRVRPGLEVTPVSAFYPGEIFTVPCRDLAIMSTSIIQWGSQAVPPFSASCARAHVFWVYARPEENFGVVGSHLPLWRSPT